MTNTHINVGGHKITTNKVGSVHTVTTLLNGFTFVNNESRIRWCVTNGICHVEIWGVHCPYTTDQRVITDVLPKAKLSGSTYCIAGNVLYIWATGTVLVCQCTALSDMYNSLEYPVADDWEESTTSEQSAR